MWVMNQALTVGLDFPGNGPAGPEHAGPRQGLPPIHGGVLGASGPLGWCALVYMDDCLVHSPTLEQHLLDVAEVLEIFRRRQLYAKSSKCEFGRQELGFLGHRLSKAGVSVDPRKVQSIVEWATPTSCCEVRRFTGLANYYRRFIEGNAEVAAQQPDSAVHVDGRDPGELRRAEAGPLLGAGVAHLRSGPACRAGTTDASNFAIAAILSQPDEE